MTDRITYRIPYQYSPADIEHFRQRIHELAGEVDRLEHAARREKLRNYGLYDVGNQIIGLPAAYQDWITAGMVGEVLGKRLARAIHLAAVASRFFFWARRRLWWPRRWHL